MPPDGTPEDDRVWLARANLAIRTGAYDEAKHWLDACQATRSDDPPVWRARLNWGMATNQVDVVKDAQIHWPDLKSTPAQLHSVNAWLANHRGDFAGERQELEALITVDPSKVTALGRLAELAERDGQPARAAEYRRKQGDVQRLLARSLKLNARKQPFRDAPELARIAEQLGRRFEARAFLTIALSDDPSRDDLRRELQRLTHSP